MKRNVIETVMGAVVLMVAGLFLVFAYNSADLQSVGGYTITARFNAVDGLATGNDIRVGGVKVGSVVDQKIDTNDYRAVVRMTIRPDVRLPMDTTAVVSSDGLLGGKYIRLDPGSADSMLQEGAELTNTQDIVSLEEMLGKVIFLVTDELSDSE